MKVYFKKLAYSVISTRFIVFMVGTFLLWNKKIEGSIWLFTALGYYGVRTLNKFIDTGGTKKDGPV